MSLMPGETVPLSEIDLSSPTTVKEDPDGDTITELSNGDTEFNFSGEESALGELRESARQGAVRGRSSLSRLLDSTIARLEAARVEGVDGQAALIDRPKQPPLQAETADLSLAVAGALLAFQPTRQSP